MKASKITFLFLIFTIWTCGLCIEAQELNSAESRAALQKIIKDYLGLYARDTLDQWKQLFHPSAVIMFPADDGTITTRTVDEFYERQRNFFATGKTISERMENLQVAEGRRIARVTSDFVFIADGEENRGKLGLHFVEGKDGWKIVGLVFSYDKP